MKRATPVRLQHPLDAAHALAKAGITFVCVPVMSENDHSDLIHLTRQRLGQLAEQAEAEEKH